MCELSRRVDTGWPDLHPEPGSLLAFQRKATCLAPSADLNTVCPKNLAAQQPPPQPPAPHHKPGSLRLSLSSSLHLIPHAQTTTTTTTTKTCVSSLRLAPVGNVSAFTSSRLTQWGLVGGLVYATCRGVFFFKAAQTLESFSLIRSQTSELMCRNPPRLRF